MKLVPENINEAIKHLPARTDIDPRELQKDKYINEFVDILTAKKGKDGFPWSNYEDYAWQEIENNPKLLDLIDQCMDKMPAKDAVKKLHHHFESGIKF